MQNKWLVSQSKTPHNNQIISQKVQHSYFFKDFKSVSYNSDVNYMNSSALVDGEVISKVLPPNTCYRLYSRVFLVKFLSGECHGTPLMISQ